MPKIMSAVDGMMILILSDNVFDANCNFLSTSLENVVYINPVFLEIYTLNM